MILTIFKLIHVCDLITDVFCALVMNERINGETWDHTSNKLKNGSKMCRADRTEQENGEVPQKKAN